MKKYLEMAVEFLIYATFFVPLIVIPSAYIFPFIVPKIIWLRSLVELMLGLYILLLAINWKEFRPKFTPLNITLLLFLLSFGLSTFVGTDPYHSFWDNHERMLGFLTIIHYVVYFFICGAVFRKWCDWKWVLQVFLLAGSIVMFIGILQTQYPEMLLNQGSERVASTLGNSIYVGGYGLFLAFIAYLLAVKEKNSIVRSLEIVGCILGILGMFFSGSRGSILGLLAGVSAGIIGYIITLKDKPLIRWVLVALAGAVLVVMSTLYIFRKTNFVANLPAIGRTVNTSLEDVKASPRWIAWTIAVESWKERPVFGWGPNNFFYAFNAHYNPRSLSFGYSETWFDNAHNIILNTLAVQGIFGLLTYLSIFGIGIYSLVIARRRDGLDMHIAVIGSAFLVAHIVNNITVFENPTSYLYFMFWVAFINSMSAKKDILPIMNDKKIGFGLVSTVAVFSLLLIFIFNIQPARANKMTLDALRALSQDPGLGIAASQKALSFASPHIDDIRSDIARSVGQLLTPENIQKIGVDKVKELFEMTYDNLKQNIILHPLDIRNHLSLAQLAQNGYGITKDGKYISEAIGFSEQALKISPRRQQIIYFLSNLYNLTGKTDRAVELLESAIADNAQIAEGYWRLALAYQTVGNNTEARAVIIRAEKAGITFDSQIQNAIETSILSQKIKSK